MSDIEAVAEAPKPSAAPRAERLKQATHTLHGGLDNRMMGADLFSSLDRYALFLSMQRRFHADIAPLYRSPSLAAIVPDLAERPKLAEIDQDLADIERPAPADAASPVDPRDAAAALGWLYVAEGSSLGAAFLFKAAQALGLGADHGARHLAPHPEGRGLNWRRFTEALNAAELSPEEDARAEAAAVAAFGRVRAIAEETLSGR